MAVCITVMTGSFGVFFVAVLFGWLWGFIRLVGLWFCLVLFRFCWFCLFVRDGVVCLFFKLPTMLATPVIFA